MIALIFDTETTGLDPDVDRIVQYGALAYDTVEARVIDSRTWLAWDKSFPLVAEGIKVHGWNLATLMKYAMHPGNALREFRQWVNNVNPNLIVAHNGIFFDRNMLLAEMRRYQNADPVSRLLELPWLDTIHHASYPGCPSKSLLTLAAFHGFLNPFPHNALSDCLTLAKLLDLNPKLVHQMAETAAEDSCLIFANIPPKFNAAQNKIVKAKKFVFQEFQGHFYEKSWIRIIPAKDYATFAASCDFQVNIIKDLPAADAYVSLYKELLSEAK